jgi:plasmid stabilization system protein ParE
VRLRYTLPALADLDSILTYIADASPQGAKRVQKRIQDVINLLLTHPQIGIRTEDPVIRRLTTTPYLFSSSTKSATRRSLSTLFVTRPAIPAECLARADALTPPSP